MLHEDSPIETEHSIAGNEKEENITMNNINTREGKCGENVCKPKLARTPEERRSEYRELD